MTAVLERPTGPQTTPPRSGPARLAGLDVARALALAGMLLAHFAFSRRADDPGWLVALDKAADGRAAPLFCVLLGVGTGLLAAAGTSDTVLVRRGLVLVAAGLALWPYATTVYVILPQYGVLLLALVLLRRLPTATLLPAALVAFVVPSVVAASAAGHGLRQAPQPSTYAELGDVAGLVRNLLWTGGYPLAGWVGFALVGLWLARLDLRSRAVQARLLAGGAAVAALQPLLAWVEQALGGPTDLATGGGLVALLDASAHSNRTAWYVLSSATAVAAVGACLLLVGAGRSHARWPAWHRPVARVGEVALTVYVAHLVLGEQVVWDWLARAKPALVTEVALVAAVLVAAGVAAWAWPWRRGPLEAAVRWLGGAAGPRRSRSAP